MRNKGMECETVPLGNHRQNPAEPAIQTFKSCFMTVTNGLDNTFPEGAWDHLIPQTNMTLESFRNQVSPLRSLAINDLFSLTIRWRFEIDFPRGAKNMREPIKSGHVSVLNFNLILITFSRGFARQCEWCLGTPPVNTDWKRCQPTLGFSQNQIRGLSHTLC